MNANEEELRRLFANTLGFKRLSFKDEKQWPNVFC